MKENGDKLYVNSKGFDDFFNSWIDEKRVHIAI